MHGTKVAKFGGSSLADAAQIKRVMEIIKSDPTRRFIVVSAPGKRFDTDYKITDLLIALREGNGQTYKQNFDEIEKRFSSIAGELGLGPQVWHELYQLEKDSGKPDMDFLKSRGEYLCAKMLAEFSGFIFVDSTEIIRLNENGSVNFVESQMAFDNLLKANPDGYFVIPGFYGGVGDRVKTFSRGGSDYSGAVIAALAKAEVYENWTDVSGMYRADPRVVQNPKPIDVISYSELRELTYMGATVLHDEVVFPLQKAGIPIRIKNTYFPEHEGTLIVPDSLLREKKKGFVGIAGRKDFTVITLAKALMNQEKGFLFSMHFVFKEHDVSVEHTPGSIDTVSVLLDNTQLLNGKLQRILDDLKEVCNPDTIKVRKVALICVVVRGMNETPGVSGDVLAALAIKRINDSIINKGASEMNIMVGVNNDDYEKATQAIYSVMDR